MADFEVVNLVKLANQTEKPQVNGQLPADYTV